MSRVATYLGAGLLLVASLVLVVAGTTAAIVAVGLVVVVVALVCFGLERVGFAFLGLAFLTAPFYKGLALNAQWTWPGTPTDLFLVLAFVLLLPRLLAGRTSFAPPYVLGVTVMLLTGTLASVASADPTASLVVLIQWLVCIAVLPLLLASLHLDSTTINRLAWTFVAGHLISAAYAVASGPVPGSDRYDGLAQHPNAFAQSGVLAFALLLHLAHRSKRNWPAWTAMAICLASVYVSGSRGGTITVAALVLLIPVVERSALAGYLVTFAGVATGLVVAQLVQRGETGGSVTRLFGGGGASGSDSIRRETLADGLDRFREHPLLGNGLLDLAPIHNNFVEAAVAIGVVGLVGYLMVLWSLARGLFGRSDLRRLCYPVVAYAAFGATVPSLTDRSVWMAVALSVAVFHGFLVPPERARNTRSLPKDELRPTGRDRLAPARAALDA